MYKPRKGSPRCPYMCYVYPLCTYRLCFSAGPERNIPFKPFYMLRGSLPICVAKAMILAAGCFCGPRAVTWKAGKEAMDKQCSGCYLLKHKAGALSQLL